MSHPTFEMERLGGDWKYAAVGMKYRSKLSERLGVNVWICSRNSFNRNC